ncbi:MAG: hypothetical protein ABMA15_08760 [Vicinamibacterales bacterium]
MTRPARLAALVAGAIALLLVAWLLRPSPALEPSAPVIPAPLGGPILVVGDHTASDGLDGYLAEILRTEGWTAFSALDVSSISSQSLGGVRLAILPWSTRVDSATGAALEDFVRSGGALICLGPRPTLESLTGVSATPGSWSFVTLPLFDDTREERATVQVFGATAGLTPGRDVDVMARFVDAPGGRESTAAVTTHRYGAGRVATFGFDPARTVAYLRQGNPDWRGEDRDGAPGPRASDAFVGWTDLSLAVRPQADDHMRLLSAVIESLLADSGGLPRLWYFPAAEPALLVASGDAHGSSVSAIETGLGLVERAGGRMSLYYDPSRSSRRVPQWARRAWRSVRAWWRPGVDNRPSPGLINAWRTRGHEIAPHPVVSNEDAAASYSGSVSAFNEEGFGFQPSTVRTHAVFWRGWVESAKLEQQFGFGLTLDYYQSGPWLKRADGHWTHANFTGSGLPMRLVDEHGTLLGIRQLTTTMADEQLIASAYDGWEGLDADGAIAVSREVFERAALTHGVPVIQFHLDFLEPSHPLRPTITRWVEKSMDLAKSHRIPIWSASRLLAFERCREQTRVVGAEWSGPGRLRFAVEQPRSTPCGVTIQVPRRPEPEFSQLVAVTLDGTSVQGAVVPLGRRRLLPVGPGVHSVDLQFGPSTAP